MHLNVYLIELFFLKFFSLVIGIFGILWNICMLGGLSDEFTRADPNLWNWSRPFYCGLYGIYRLLMLSVLF